MVVYNFKRIAVVPSGKDMLDIILSKTQRKTPTVVHKGYNITRIRQFYMRKVKYTQQNYHEKLAQILEEFPKLDDIHPFYADLMNILYDRDHYKLALGQLNVTRALVDNVAKDYIRLLKYGDSLYRCKQLKRAALGRMCTAVKRCNGSLTYLEQVRQHLGRLPSIDPTSRTLIVAGFPNVGKSSFVNKVTHADVEVQPYPFTTKSLFVGHFDHNYLRWQVIDTPGVLDHALEQRNTIEMQSITVMAHLRAAILFFVDISAQCGYSVADQLTLFDSIRPLFVNKPLVLVLSKTDVTKWEELDSESKQLIEDVKQKVPGIFVVSISVHNEEGLTNVLDTACAQLLDMRVEQKLKSKSSESVLSRVHVSQPQSRAGVQQRPAMIPESVWKDRQSTIGLKKMDDSETEKRPVYFETANPIATAHAAGRILEKDLEIEDGGPGIYSVDLRKKYDLRLPEFKYDVIPEIMDGKNIADFVDPEIEARLMELEKEEEERMAMMEAQGGGEEEEESDLDEEEMAALEKIRDKKFLLMERSRRERKAIKPRMTRKQIQRTKAEMKGHLEELGLDGEKAARAAAGELSGSDMSDGEGRRGRSRSRRRVKRGRDESMDVDSSRALKRGRSSTRGPRDTSVKDVRTRQKVEKIVRKAQAPFTKKERRLGEADRTIASKMPKHLFSGKRRLGTHNHR